MGPYCNIVSENIRSSIAPRTWEDYSSSWRDWPEFCAGFNSYPLCSDVNLFLCYLASCMSRGLSASYISKIFAGISFFLKLNGFPSILDNFIIKQALKGYKKSFPRQDSRRPITPEILEKIVNIIPIICNSPYESSLFRAVFVIAFFGALRISEFVAPNKSSQSNLRTSDVFISQHGLKNFIRHSKTDQAGRGAWINLLPFPSPICPVSAASNYLALRPACLGNFFIHQNGSVLTKFQFNSILHASLRYLNLDAFKFSSHSFRIGAATEAARLGLHSSLIKRLGRWESDRFRIYVRPNLIVRV